MISVSVRMKGFYRPPSFSTHDMFGVDLLDECRVLLKVDVRTERDFVHGHFSVNLVTVHSDKVVGLFQEVLDLSKEWKIRIQLWMRRDKGGSVDAGSLEHVARLV